MAYLSDVLTAMLDGVVAILQAVATAIAENAAIIGTLLITGALIGMVVTVGSRLYRGISGWFRGLV
jgi:hypothetical protein